MRAFRIEPDRETIGPSDGQWHQGEITSAVGMDPGQDTAVEIGCDAEPLEDETVIIEAGVYLNLDDVIHLVQVFVPPEDRPSSAIMQALDALRVRCPRML